MDLLRHLRYFVVVAEERHFGHAAQRLHMAQPPLSQQIRRLEAELGFALFYRTTRRVDLTEAGTAYLARARSILASVDAAADEGQRVAAGVMGRLTLGCVGSVAYGMLPTLSRELDAHLPGIDFAFRGELLVSEQLEALRTGTIDLGLLWLPVNESSLAVERLRKETLVVAMPSDHHLAEHSELSIDDLAQEDLIVHSAGRRSAIYDRVRALFDGAGVTPRIRHEVGETSTLITLVAGGLGVAVVPAPVEALSLAGLTYRPMVSPVPTIELGVARRIDRDEPHLLRTVEVIGRSLAGGQPTEL